MTIYGYAAKQAKQALEKFEYQPKPLGDYEVEITISHCGVCHSDVHLVDNDWGFSSYPLLPGHEIIGTIAILGSQVTHLALGQRVGVGWQRSSCMQCEWCLKGQENLCAQAQPTCVGQPGGFATAIRVDSRFVFVIPEQLASADAAPLLCGGVTVYSSMRTHGVTSDMRVGVIGIGGLGHLALQFANAMGCEVTAISSNASKQAEAQSFGAHHFMTLTDEAQLRQAFNSLDFIVSTVHADLNWDLLINLLKSTGKLCLVGVPHAPVKIPAFSLISGQKSICGSMIGGRAMIQEMLDFAARHQITAKTQIKPMSEANNALTDVRNNRARYRIVLSNDTK